MLGSLTVPPQKPLIVDDRGRQVEGEVGIGPFREGESLSLECNVPGGKFCFTMELTHLFVIFCLFVTEDILYSITAVSDQGS